MIRKRAIAALGLVVLILGLTSSSAWATVQEEREGEAIYNQIRSGQLACSTVTPSQFELVGEYAMGKMIGSPSAHEAMNERIKARLGGEGEEKAHRYLGARYAGCATGAAPREYTTMMSMMGTQGGSSGSGMMAGGGTGMMGGHSGSGYGHHEGGMDGWWVAAIIVGGAAIIGLVLFLVTRRRRDAGPPSATPINQQLPTPKET